MDGTLNNAEWVFCDASCGAVYCSSCGKSVDTGGRKFVDFLENARFCQNCGACMLKAYRKKASDSENYESGMQS